jgi:hypothetical protein
MDDLKERLTSCSRERRATLDLSGVKCGAEGAAIVGNFLPKCWGLLKLVLSQSALLSKEAGRALSGALAANPALIYLDVSNNYDHSGGATDGPGFAQALAEGLATNSVLSELVVSNNTLCGYLDSNFQWVSELSGLIALCEAVNHVSRNS